MSTEAGKKAAALKAVDYLKHGMKVGIGSGSTVKHFIDALAKSGKDVVCVASSVETEKLAKAAKIRLTTLNEHPQLDVYVDGADEVDAKNNLIKGGGGALTREKILASASYEFIVIVDESKMVKKLGAFPVAIEVLPMAEEYVKSEFAEIGGTSVTRKKFTTDNGNIIIDVTGLDFKDPLELETELNNIPGIIENGIFSVRQPDVIIIGKGAKTEVKTNL